MRLLVLICLIPLLSAADKPTPIELKVMTYNLRYASERMPNAWSARRAATKGVIEQQSPDIIGTQEGVQAQLADMQADLPAYAMLGQGRNGGDKGEYMAVFYRRDRLKVMETQDFWLSATPEEVGSTTWGNTLPRMVTWVRFKEQRSDREFYFFNTHFDHQSQTAREQSAMLIRQRITALPRKLPVLLVGDFNAAAQHSKVYEIFMAEGFLTDLFRTAPQRSGEELSTFHDFGPARKNGVHIDWLLGRGGWQALTAEVVTYDLKGQSPSDHFPVSVKVTLE